MSFTTSLGAKTIHAYTAVVAIAAIFNMVGMIGTVQVLGVTLFFGFAALLDELAGLSQNINSVNERLERVTRQLDRVNGGGQTPDEVTPRDRDQGGGS